LYIIKRDGHSVEFDQRKIYSAIFKASEASGEKLEPIDIEYVTHKVVSQLQDPCTVEQVQDIVERTLIRYDYEKTAKAYILYRAQRAKLRNFKSELMEIYDEIVGTDAIDSDIKRENANVDGDTAMGSMLKFGSEGAKYYIDKYVLPEDIAKAHRDGDIHIHDKDFYTLTMTCCQIDLNKLFKNGFSTGHGYLREPQSIQSYASLACIAIQANQNEMHGGQSIPAFDYFMAPGVVKTFVKEFKTNLAYGIEDLYGISPTDAEVIAKEFTGRIEGIAFDPIETGFAEELAARLNIGHNVSLEFVKDMFSRVYERSFEKTNRATYQAMEGLVHNLNTMNSRAGAQVPFSSINFGTDTSPEGRMVIKNLLLATEAGLGNGETAIFPVSIFKVKEGINFNEDDPNYDLFKLAIKVSAKRLFPNFSFLDAPFNLAFYEEGNYNKEVAYMGCRTRVMANHHDPSKAVVCGRGNLSFTSINLPRLGIEAHGDLNKFYKSLDEKLELASRQLLHRLKIQSAKKGKNYPFLMGQGIWIDSDKIGPNDEVKEVIEEGTLSIGFIGLAETMVALTGHHHGENEEARKTAFEIVKHMREFCDKKSNETNLNFTLLATPAEGLSGRFVKIDKKKYGVIPGVTDRDYYTNSFHVPVYYPISAFEKIKIEAPYHDLTNAG
jgi:ribonucleoside-triphosphate reductase